MERMPASMILNLNSKWLLSDKLFLHILLTIYTTMMKQDSIGNASLTEALLPIAFLVERRKRLE